MMYVLVFWKHGYECFWVMRVRSPPVVIHGPQVGVIFFLCHTAATVLLRITIHTDEPGPVFLCF